MISSVLTYDSRERKVRELIQIKNSLAEKWLGITGNVELSTIIANAIVDEQQDENKILANYELILKMFNSKGFDSEEAIKYINFNSYLLFLPINRIANVLAVLAIAHIEEEVFFCVPNMFSTKNSIKRIYGAAKKSSSRGNNTSLVGIMKDFEEQREDEEIKLSDIKLRMLTDCYLKNLDTKNQERIL